MSMNATTPHNNETSDNKPNELFPFSDHDYQYIKELIREYTGIHLDHTKRFLVQTRLSKRLKLLGLKSFHEYRIILESDNDLELEHLANAITTNTTSFFRHDHHFTFLNTVFKEYETKKEFKELKIWSAGCSSGEEPYTIAWIAYNTFSPENLEKIKILATDIDSETLRIAEKGVYHREVLSQISESKLRDIFLRGKGENTGYFKVKPEVRSLVDFRKINLIEKWPVKGPFDIIFCRNVCIYFHKDTQRVLMERLADMQEKGGYLFIGQSENLFATCNFYKTLEHAIYQKIY